MTSARSQGIAARSSFSAQLAEDSYAWMPSDGHLPDVRRQSACTH